MLLQIAIPDAHRWKQTEGARTIQCAVVSRVAEQAY